MRYSKLIARIALYLLGLIVLASGLVLNAKTSLGVSPIIAIAYGAAEYGGLNFGDLTFLWYSVLVLAEIGLHIRIKKEHLKRVILFDLLQLPLSLVFTRFMNLFSAMIPVFSAAYPDSFAGSFPGRLLFLLLAVVLTGIGAALSLDMQIIPNPGDGIVQAVADTLHWKTGNAKNAVDISCVLLAVLFSLITMHRLVGVGLGTVIAMLGIGRVVALFNKLFLPSLRPLLNP